MVRTLIPVAFGVTVIVAGCTPPWSGQSTTTTTAPDPAVATTPAPTTSAPQATRAAVTTPAVAEPEPEEPKIKELPSELDRGDGGSGGGGWG
ncbi:MAG: hypothetical protein AB3N15_16480 [Paracoccaceae bacterium]